MTLRERDLLGITPDALQEAVRLGVGKALYDMTEIAPGLRRTAPSFVVVPQSFNRLPLHAGTCTIDLQAGTVMCHPIHGVITTFQPPQKFIARSFFILADDHLQVQGNGPRGRWGPFQVQQCTPHVFDNVEIVTLDIT